MRESRREPRRPPIPPIWGVTIVGNNWEIYPSRLITYLKRQYNETRQEPNIIQPSYQDDDKLAGGEGDIRCLGRHQDAHIVGQADHLAVVVSTGRKSGRSPSRPQLKPPGRRGSRRRLCPEKFNSIVNIDYSCQWEQWSLGSMPKREGDPDPGDPLSGGDEEGVTLGDDTAELTGPGVAVTARHGAQHGHTQPGGPVLVPARGNGISLDN